MKHFFTAAALAASFFGLAQGSAVLAGPVYTGPVNIGPVNIGRQGAIAVSGYDAVSYFTGDGTPIKGSPSHAVQHMGAVYHFATAANAETFAADPERYAPQYGGHCAWAMARGSLAPGDPLQSRIVDGRLYLNYNAQVRAMWLKDIPGFIASADKRWPSIPDDAKFGN